jgi:hypothetical protein
MRNFPVPHPSGDLRASKFIPDEFVLAYSPLYALEFNSQHRARVTPAKRSKGNKAKTPNEPESPTPAERRVPMT